MMLLLPINLKPVFHLHVSGLITIGESKLAMDCTPAISPCAFACNIINILPLSTEHENYIPYNLE